MTNSKKHTHQSRKNIRVKASPNLPKLAYSVNEILDILPLGRTSLYAAIKTKKLRATKLGKKTLFLAPDVTAFLESLPSIAGGAQ